MNPFSQNPNFFGQNSNNQNNQNTNTGMFNPGQTNPSGLFNSGQPVGGNTTGQGGFGNFSGAFNANQPEIGNNSGQNTFGLFSSGQGAPNIANQTTFGASTSMFNPPQPTGINPTNQGVFPTGSNLNQTNQAQGLFNSGQNVASQNQVGVTPSLFDTTTPIVQQTNNNPFGSINNPIVQQTSDIQNTPVNQIPTKTSEVLPPNASNISNPFQSTKPFSSTESSKDVQEKVDISSISDSNKYLINSIKDNSVNLYNLTLQEILDRHSIILDSNIKEFDKEAERVFERDLRLIQNKNNFIKIQNKIEEENKKLDELAEAMDFFEERLNNTDHPGKTEMGKVVEDFENICDKFYAKVESLKDIQDDVLDLVNENYELIEQIDRKIDILSEIKL